MNNSFREWEFIVISCGLRLPPWLLGWRWWVFQFGMWNMFCCGCGEYRWFVDAIFAHLLPRTHIADPNSHATTLRFPVNSKETNLQTICVLRKNAGGVPRPCISWSAEETRIRQLTWNKFGEHKIRAVEIGVESARGEPESPPKS